MFIDSHCHLDHLNLDNYDDGLDAALTAAMENGVSHFLCVCIDLEHFQNVISLAEKYDNVFASVGTHPNHCDSEAPTVKNLVELSDHQRVVALGETGLDYCYTEEAKAIQQERFHVHLEAAHKVGKPVIVHTRDAKEDTLAILREGRASECGAVLHCFTGDYDMARQAVDMGLYVSFTGILTFNSAADLREIVKKLPLENLLIETDSPWLAPVPFRGKPNEPMYVPEVAKCMANIKGISVEELGEKTTENFFRLFSAAG